MSDDNLEERKDEVWSMDEVRSFGSTPSETAETPDELESVDTSDTTDTADRGDREDRSDTQSQEDTAETADTSDTEDTSSTADTSDTRGTEDTSVTVEGHTVREMAVDAEEKGLTVRDLHNVNVYLYEDIYREMVASFKDLDSEYFRKHGEELSKNKDFFNAVFKAGLESDQLRAELELD